MFIEISNLKKGYGYDGNRVEVLKGISAGVERARYVYCLDHQVQENQHFLI